ncbi:MAG: hypothetical protein DMD91_19905 [Candidatus Rokuibacteriota bacterium]|nr:MAG: hypothetical protein DMD91_19905 [Candidatus Rokubacteria bacterium]
MSGIVFALSVFIVGFLAHLVYSHLVVVESKEPVLIRFMVAASVAYAVAYPFAAPILVRYIESPVGAWVDFASGLSAMGFFVLGYIEFWSLIERSFSLRILVDAAEVSGGLTREEISSSYSVGRGLDWMMKKRIDDLVGSRMLVKEHGDVRLTAGARVIARGFAAVQRAFALE